MPKSGYKLNTFTYLILLSIFLLNGCQYLGKKSPPAEVQKTHNPCIVLALPASGAYATVANKIKKGAQTAVEQLKSTGIEIRLENVNTEASNWIKTLDALPPYCAVVGGPLQDKAYIQARAQGALNKRIFFSFVQNLQAGDEGDLAWRFFPGPDDQVEALANFGVDTLQIHSYGALYPDDAYGRRMTGLMEKNLAKRHIPLQKASYDPQAPASWSDAAKTLINPQIGEDGKTLLPQTSFEAVFLPDSWRHMDMITQSLLYNGEDRLVLMGPMLWEQNLAGKKVGKPEKYALAVFPGAWNEMRAPKILQNSASDFWVALGFDFINFAVSSGLDSRLASADITKRAQTASSAIRGMAPITWDNNGIAHQKLYLFQPDANGIKLLNNDKFQEARQRVAENAYLRMQGIGGTAPLPQETAPQKLPAIEPPTQSTAPADVTQRVSTQIPAPNAPSLSPVPRPSYKLRLPNQN